MRHFVRTPHGICAVTLEREGLDLDERGGFVAEWAGDTGVEAVLELDAYRKIVKAYLEKIYREKHGQEAGNVALNLASHQLIDDLNGWTKLNWRPNR